MRNIESIVALFKQAHKNNKLSHLYLLSGPKGSGKKKVSYEVSAYLLGQDVESIKRGHINLYFIEPDNNTIKVEQIEELQKEFSKTSLVSGYRIFIIEHVDLFTIPAANKLLKFLEEPTSVKTIGFLLTTNKEKVINTILSRSQNINLPAPTESDLKEKLLSLEVDSYKAEILPFLDKNIDNLKELCNDPKINHLLEVFDGFTETLVKEESIWLYSDKYMNDIKYDKIYLSYFLQILLIFYLDLFKLNNGEEVSFKSLEERYNNYKIGKKKVLKNIELIQNLILKLNFNINLDLAFNEFLLNL
ncbi:MAG: ATP-binding protein [Acholeplasmatales bacterium]